MAGYVRLMYSPRGNSLSQERITSVWRWVWLVKVQLSLCWSCWLGKNENFIIAWALFSNVISNLIAERRGNVQLPTEVFFHLISFNSGCENKLYICTVGYFSFIITRNKTNPTDQHLPQPWNATPHLWHQIGYNITKTDITRFKRDFKLLRAPLHLSVVARNRMFFLH